MMFFMGEEQLKSDPFYSVKCIEFVLKIMYIMLTTTFSPSVLFSATSSVPLLTLRKNTKQDKIYKEK